MKHERVLIARRTPRLWTMGPHPRNNPERVNFSASAGLPQSCWKRPPQAWQGTASLARTWFRRRGNDLQSNRASRTRGEIGPCKRKTPNQLPNRDTRQSSAKSATASTLKLTRVMVGSAHNGNSLSVSKERIDMSGRPQRDGKCVTIHSTPERTPSGVKSHHNRVGLNQLPPCRTGCPRSL